MVVVHIPFVQEISVRPWLKASKLVPTMDWISEEIPCLAHLRAEYSEPVQVSLRNVVMLLQDCRSKLFPCTRPHQASGAYIVLNVINAA